MRLERDQARRRVLITRNLAELVRLSLDLVPIKGPREALGSKLAPGASRASRFVDFNFDIGTPTVALPIVLLHPANSVPRYSSSFFSLYLPFLQFSGELATAPGIDDVYGRTPVIGWSRFIDGRISRLERALRARDARRGIPAAIPISGEFPRAL